MRVEMLSQEAQFHALKEEWNGLLQQSGNNEITLTWEWLYTWWQVFKDDTRELFILTVRETSGEILGIAPFYIRTVRPYFFLPAIRQIHFLASGEEEADEICSDYLNFILYAGREHEILSELLRHLSVNFSKLWDEMCLYNIRSDTPTSQAFLSLLENHPTPHHLTLQGPCLYIKLPENWDTFLQQASSDLRSNIRKNRKALAQEGQISFLIATSEKTIEEALEVLIRLHQKRWTEKGKPGVFLSEKFLLFHKTFLSIALKNDWLKLYVLLLDHAPIAAIYNFKYNHKIYFYQSGTNTHLKTNLSKAISPGFALHSYCIEEALLEGMREYDFLAGGSIYKRRWTKTSRDLITLGVASASDAIHVVNKARATAALMRRIKGLILRNKRKPAELATS